MNYLDLMVIHVLAQLPEYKYDKVKQDLIQEGNIHGVKIYGIHIYMHGIDSQNQKGKKRALFKVVNFISISRCCDLENWVKVKLTYILNVFAIRLNLVQTILVCLLKLISRAQL